MTKDEFMVQVRDFTDNVASEYTTDARCEYIEPGGEYDDHEAMITLTFGYNNNGTLSIWEVPIGIDHDGNVAIVANADADAFLDLDAGGLYAYLFFEAELVLRKRCA